MSARTERLVVRVTPEQLAELEAKAEAAGLPLADWVRLTLLGRPTPKARPGRKLKAEK